MAPPPLLLCLVATTALFACGREAPPPALQYASAPDSDKRVTYSLAIHPLHNPSKLQTAYQPLMEYLNREIPEARFELEASRDYASFEEKVGKKKPEFILPNPWQTLGAMKNGYRVIAMAGDEAEFKGIFLVRKESSIKAPSDLKGKAVSYPAPTALAACIMPQYFLFQHGVDVNKDIENRYVGSQESSIMNVYLGEVAAGTTWPAPWKLFQQEHPSEAAQLKVIWETPHLQNNSVMARSDIATELSTKVANALVSLDKTSDGRQILDGMATHAFLNADNQTYRPVEKFIATFERDVRRIAP